MKISRVLVVEDDISLALTLKQLLVRQNLTVTCVRLVEDACSVLEKKSFIVAIVDRKLPDGDGLEVVEYAQHIQFPTRTLVLSALFSTQDRIQALEKGATDYLAKPFSQRELELRITNLISLDKRTTQPMLSYRDISLRPHTGELHVRDQRIQLRPRESAVLHCLLKHPRHIVTREMFIEYIWSGQEIPDYRTIDVYLRRVRAALRTHRSMIKTVRGFGFKLE